MSDQKIIIVSEGSYGDILPSDYRGQAEILGAFLESKKAEFEVLSKAEEADSRLSKGDVKTIIFLSRGQIENAEKIHEIYPQITVIVHAGSFPERWNRKGIHAFEKADSAQMKKMINLAIG